MCIESRGHDSPHREQSKIDAVVPQLQFDYGYMGGWRPSTDSVLPRGNRHLFWSHPRDDGTGLQEDGHAHVVETTAKVCVTWSMNAFVYMETKKEFYNCYWTNGKKNVVLKDKTGRFCDKCHRHRAIRAMEQRRKPSPQYVDLLEHIWQ